MARGGTFLSALSLLMLSCPWLLLYETENDFSINCTAKNVHVWRNCWVLMTFLFLISALLKNSSPSPYAPRLLNLCPHLQKDLLLIKTYLETSHQKKRLRWLQYSKSECIWINSPLKCKMWQKTSDNISPWWRMSPLKNKKRHFPHSLLY